MAKTERKIKSLEKKLLRFSIEEIEPVKRKNPTKVKSKLKSTFKKVLGEVTNPKSKTIQSKDL